ncbi:hypothetical protein FIBSPDRAFT_951364 [Athelia psychrophila]|uniref:Carbamoyl-phosphate synthetase large subunit-like ATP-binding domain-containing protein n=1 Tax=Athelia psychrophila TaxID=1759441 RepID=A0A166MUJ0_9AGAM|nr:hypothetical protein FIBSPDRAFT_951364 [Fibularhizoctonia sp. CBS 109695]
MACALRYQGVGTFAYLENSRSGDWVFLQIKPCVQVEHGVSIAGPAGRGVHTDTRLRRAGRDLREATQQAVRALRETGVGKEEDGVKTNGKVLAGVVAHAHWEERKCDMMWLKRELRDVMRIGMELLKPRVEGLGLQRQQGAEEVTVSWTWERHSTRPSLRQDPNRRGHEEADTPDSRAHRLILSPGAMVPELTTRTSGCFVLPRKPAFLVATRRWDVNLLSATAWNSY